MSPDQRLQYHQEKSGPLIEKLKDWLTSQIEQNLVDRLLQNRIGHKIFQV
jgi:hypothetical protein